MDARQPAMVPLPLLGRRGVRGRGRPLSWLLLLAATACQVEWGGARLALEDPAPQAEAAEPAPRAAEPLPPGPLLYAARLDDTGNARVVPVARLPAEGGLPLALEPPSPLTEDYRARFDSAFLRPGSELTIQRWGRRIGTLVLQEPSRIVDRGCPSVAPATALLLPGEPPPPMALAVPGELAPRTPARAGAPEPTQGMLVAGPVLAERFIADQRAFLARRVALEAVLLPGDTAPGMAATYLVNDSLAPGPPGPEAISLFFLARHEPVRGYVGGWREIRRYDTAGEKEAFEYLDWIRLPAGVLHVLRRVDGSAAGLAAAFLPEGEEEPRVAWREEGCSALGLLTESDEGTE